MWSNYYLFFPNRTVYPNAKDNPYTAVLKGYVTRKRDEEIEHKEKVDFFSGIKLCEMAAYRGLWGFQWNR